MVDIVNHAISVRAMPVDFASYLMSASPPGFDSLHQYSSLKTSISEPKFSSMATTISSPTSPSSSSSSSPSASKDRLYHKIIAAVATTTSPSTPTTPKPTRNTPKKRVSFADDMGKALTSVRVMTDQSQTAPVIESLSALIAIGSAAYRLRPITSGHCTPATPPSCSNPVLKFAQPVSDYVAFSERLRTRNVSLENVVVSGRRIAGTVSVANIGYEKAVCVRCSADQWRTHYDVTACYVSPSAAASRRQHHQHQQHDRYDRFSFELTMAEDQRRLQFCVRYEVSDSVYWDNNGGANYEILSRDVSPTVVPRSTARRRSSDADTIFAFDFQENWTDFGWWQHSIGSDPYW